MPEPIAREPITLKQGEDSDQAPTIHLTNEDGSDFNLTGYTLSCQWRAIPDGRVILTPDIDLVGVAADGVVEHVFTSAQSYAIREQTFTSEIWGTHATQGTKCLVEIPITFRQAIKHP